ncbi:MAG: metallophosphoesterase [Desulfovibrionaceae bacterium]
MPTQGGDAMPFEPIALLADIHGNLPALDAVLADALAQGVTRCVNLGDALYGPLDPAGTMARLRQLEAGTWAGPSSPEGPDTPPAHGPTMRLAASVRGNQDRIVAAAACRRDEDDDNATMRHVLDAMAPEDILWINALQLAVVVDDVATLCHGNPYDDTAYLLENVDSGRPKPRHCDHIRADLADTATPVVCCGHTHIPRIIRCHDTLIVNPGSVGLPAYDDDTPPLPPHAMETGTPHARYAILRHTPTGYDAEPRCVTYPWGQAAAMAAAQGRRDWTRWLATGKA